MLRGGLLAEGSTLLPAPSHPFVNREVHTMNGRRSPFTFHLSRLTVQTVASAGFVPITAAGPRGSCTLFP